MACFLNARCAPDGTVVNVYVNNRTEEVYRVAVTGALWTGDPSTLTECVELCDTGTAFNAMPADEVLDCVIGTAPVDFQAEWLGSFQEGWSAFPSAAFTNPNLAALGGAGQSDFPIPTAPAGSIMLLALITGQEDGSNPQTAEVSQIGRPALAAPTTPANMAAGVELIEYEGNASLTYTIYAFDQVGTGSGGTLSISFPDADPATGTQGVIQGSWIRVSRVDGMPTTTAAAIDPSSIVSQYLGGVSTPDAMMVPAVMTNTDCPSVSIGMGRHISYENTDPEGNGLQFDLELESFAFDYSAGTELYDISSISGPHNFPGGNFCNVSQSAAFIPANTSYTVDVRGNLYDGTADNNVALMAWSEQLGQYDIPLTCADTADCNPNGATTTASVNDSDCPMYEVTVSADIVATIAAGQELTLVPKINGVASVADQVVYSANTTEPFNMMFQTPSLSVDIAFCLEVTGGTGVDSNISITNQSIDMVGVQ